MVPHCSCFGARVHTRIWVALPVPTDLGPDGIRCQPLYFLRLRLPLRSALKARQAGQEAPNPNSAHPHPLHGVKGVSHHPLNRGSLPFKMPYGLFTNKLVTTTALVFPRDKSDILINT